MMRQPGGGFQSCAADRRRAASRRCSLPAAPGWVRPAGPPPAV